MKIQSIRYLKKIITTIIICRSVLTEFCRYFLTYALFYHNSILTLKINHVPLPSLSIDQKKNGGFSVGHPSLRI